MQCVLNKTAELPLMVAWLFLLEKGMNKMRLAKIVWPNSIAEKGLLNRDIDLVKYVNPKNQEGVMKKIVILILFIALLSGFISLDSRSNPESRSTDSYFLSQADNSDQVERRGCCSWHGGVCGCENGRAVCCDGTLSPTCGCD